MKNVLPPDSPIILAFHHRRSLLTSNGFTTNTDAEYKLTVRKLVYLGNSARYGHSCCRCWI